MPLKENPKKDKGPALWYSGICDELYLKIAVWDNAYWRGELHSTRKWLNPMTGRTEDKPTKMAHDIPFREVELDHLVRIVGELYPDTPLIEELKEIKSIWKYGKPVRGYRFTKSYWSVVPLPTGLHRVITMCFYQEHVKTILSALIEAKTGQKDATIAAQIAVAKQEGRDLFEEH